MPAEPNDMTASMVSEEPLQFAMEARNAVDRFQNEVRYFLAGRNYLHFMNRTVETGHPQADIERQRLMSALAPHYTNASDFFVDRAFITLVAAFELFLLDIAVAVVSRYPKKIAKVRLTFEQVLEVQSTGEVTRLATELALNEMMYKGPMDYLTEIAKLLAIDAKVIKSEWKVFVEAKLRRDLGVHAGWRVNDTYLHKAREAGIQHSFKRGDYAYVHDVDYFAKATGAMLTASGLIYEMIEEKYFPKAPEGNC